MNNSSQREAFVLSGTSSIRRPRRRLSNEELKHKFYSKAK